MRAYCPAFLKSTKNKNRYRKNSGKQTKNMNITDISDKLKQIENTFGRLSGVQKILLSTDGTVTVILDILYGKTQVKVLEQRIIKAGDKIAKLLQINKDDQINYRVVLIHKDNLPLIRAESYTPLKRISPDLKKELTACETAIGMILKKQNLEMRREILSIDADSGDSVKEVFKNTGLLLSRTYKIISGGETLIWIKEIFSQHIQ